MAEMGSFIELEYPTGKEYYTGKNIVRLNCGRAAIYHAVKAYGCQKVYLPYYQCETVKTFLESKHIQIAYYALDDNMIPRLAPNSADSAVVLVNYFGVLGADHMQKLACLYKNVVIDNSQAFFAPPVRSCLNIYSARKFFGVPDGAYVIGEPYVFNKQMYAEDYSSDTAAFLLQRIEHGCEGPAYACRTKNEERIDRSDILNMSRLTHTLLDGIDYERARRKRLQNFASVDARLRAYNLFDAMKHYDTTCVPMVYPFMSEKKDLLGFLLANKHFQGRWWQYLVQLMPRDTIEYRLSSYMVPITIDQRYGEEEICALCDLILSYLA